MEEKGDSILDQMVAEGMKKPKHFCNSSIS
jgi:hypothetical protein